jgi:hypothetical protein
MLLIPKVACVFISSMLKVRRPWRMIWKSF